MPQAQVRYVEGVGGASEQLAVTVRLPSGQVLELDGGSSPSTQTIDVEVGGSEGWWAGPQGRGCTCVRAQPLEGPRADAVLP